MKRQMWATIGLFQLLALVLLVALDASLWLILGVAVLVAGSGLQAIYGHLYADLRRPAPQQRTAPRPPQW